MVWFFPVPWNFLWVIGMFHKSWKIPDRSSEEAFGRKLAWSDSSERHHKNRIEGTRLFVPLYDSLLASPTALWSLALMVHHCKLSPICTLSGLFVKSPKWSQCWFFVYITDLGLIQILTFYIPTCRLLSAAREKDPTVQTGTTQTLHSFAVLLPLLFPTAANSHDTYPAIKTFFLNS